MTILSLVSYFCVIWWLLLSRAVLKLVLSGEGDICLTLGLMGEINVSKNTAVWLLRKSMQADLASTIRKHCHTVCLFQGHNMVFPVKHVHILFSFLSCRVSRCRVRTPWYLTISSPCSARAQEHKTNLERWNESPPNSEQEVFSFDLNGALQPAIGRITATYRTCVDQQGKTLSTKDQGGLFVDPSQAVWASEFSLLPNLDWKLAM